jgi:VanZ family protein
VTPSLRRRRIGFAGCLLVQLVVLYAPRAPATGGAPGIDKLVHVLIFAAVGVTAVRAGLPLHPVLGLLLAHAVVSEVLQATLLPGRSGDGWDVLADLAGVLLAWLLVARRTVVPADVPASGRR